MFWRMFECSPVCVCHSTVIEKLYLKKYSKYNVQSGLLRAHSQGFDLITDSDFIAWLENESRFFSVSINLHYTSIKYK